MSKVKYFAILKRLPDYSVKAILPDLGNLEAIGDSVVSAVLKMGDAMREHLATKKVDEYPDPTPQAILSEKHKGWVCPIESTVEEITRLKTTAASSLPIVFKDDIHDIDDMKTSKNSRRGRPKKKNLVESDNGVAA